MPIISVIVPVYNAFKYLSRCVDSILNQTYIDFELILVNDGSTDDSLDICEGYLGKDPRVIVIDKPNGGASSARNAGIDRAKGDFICFVDADDYVSQYYLDDLYHDMRSDNDIDLVMHGMIQVKGDHQVVISFPKSKTYILDDGSFFSDVNLFKFCGPCCKLFKKDIISKHKIRFNESIIYSEDFDFFAKYLYNSNKVHISSVENYFYVFNSNSTSTKINSFDQEYSGITNLFRSLSELNNKFHNSALDNQIKVFLSFYVSRLQNSIYEPPRQKQSERLKCLRKISDPYAQIFTDYFQTTNKYSRAFKLLFSKKCYVLYDIASLLYRRKREHGSIF